MPLACRATALHPPGVHEKQGRSWQRMHPTAVAVCVVFRRVPAPCSAYVERKKLHSHVVGPKAPLDGFEHVLDDKPARRRVCTRSPQQSASLSAPSQIICAYPSCWRLTKSTTVVLATTSGPPSDSAVARPTRCFMWMMVSICFDMVAS